MECGASTQCGCSSNLPTLGGHPLPVFINGLGPSSSLLGTGTDGSGVDAPSLQTTQSALSQVDARGIPMIPGMNSSAASINPSTGNVTAFVTIPNTGALGVQPVLTYNSRAAADSIQFGHGWSDVFNPVVSMMSSTEARVIGGAGESWFYSDLDTNGRYLAPPAL